MSNRQVELAQKYLKDQEDRKAGKTNFGDTDIKRFKVPGNSTVRLRFLPPMGHEDPACEEMFFRQVGFHYGLMEQGKSPPVCPRLTAEKSACPVCEKAFPLWNKIKEGDESADAEYQRYKATMRFLSQVVDITTDTSHEAGVQIFEYGKKIHKDLMTYLSDARNWGDFTDMAEGFVVNITATGQGKTVQYSVTLDRESTSFPVEYLDLRHDLNPLIVVPTYEDLKTLMVERATSATAGQDDMFPPAARTTPPPAALKRTTPPPAQATMNFVAPAGGPPEDPPEEDSVPPAPPAAPPAPTPVAARSATPPPAAPPPAAAKNKKTTTPAPASKPAVNQSSAIKNFLLNDSD